MYIFHVWKYFRSQTRLHFSTQLWNAEVVNTVPSGVDAQSALLHLFTPYAALVKDQWFLQLVKEEKWQFWRIIVFWRPLHCWESWEMSSRWKVFWRHLSEGTRSGMWPMNASQCRSADAQPWAAHSSFTEPQEWERLPSRQCWGRAEPWLQKKLVSRDRGVHGSNPYLCSPGFQLQIMGFRKERCDEAELNSLCEALLRKNVAVSSH